MLVDGADLNGKSYTLKELFEAARKKRWLIIIIKIYLVALVFSILFNGAVKLYNLVLPFVGTLWFNLLGIILVFCFGVGLYVFREIRRTYYGIVEVGFALASGWYGLNKINLLGGYELLTVCAAVYLVVRGVDNIVEGIKKQNEVDLSFKKVKEY